jgi:hypothetical protein
MLGNPLCDSTGPPFYKPLYHQHDRWVFGSQVLWLLCLLAFVLIGFALIGWQYFGEIFNETSNKTQAFAATGEQISCEVWIEPSKS